jgi:hypothetical protein
MKKFLMFLCAVMLVFGTVGIASATTYGFSDMIDYWNWAGTSYGETQTSDHCLDSVSLWENDSLHYTHIISDDVDFVAGDLVTSANLELDFTNDLLDIVVTGFWDWSVWDTTEHIYYAFDGSGWTYLGEVDNGQYSVGIDLSLLNIDGQLAVDLAVSNWDNGNTIAWLDHSLLSGTAETAPVPEPATILLMGIGLLGMVGIGRKRFNKKG